jgi:GNAT superfamily N-acetyltransferase
VSSPRAFVELDKKAHDRTGFDCDNASLNEFLCTQAAKHRSIGISRTMVLPGTEPAEQGLRPIEAYYTTSIAVIERETLSTGRKLQPYPVPVLLIARLAVAKDQKGQGLGKITLIKAHEHLLSISEMTSAFAVLVAPIDDNADKFYRHFGFLELKDEAGRLYLPMKAVAALFQ